ncbi:PREDICTED: vegetative cell wall protein gp1-like [Ipomoea nil]|uniref:vegetative cell wall protein gp1-like n=1 Tax=Ipomoea nil TaxID=35883 RepID=UPI0009013194|nr:PREDICTED: vegetative cell wall protein gp1-like [Ipomoea nil]
MISISRVFCLWVVFFLGSILSYGVSEARHHRPSAVVVGTVFCHTCFHQSFSDASRFISGAAVAVECGGEGRQSFREEVKTDGRGEFKVNLPFSVARGEKKIRGCSVRVISSGEPSCAVASAAATSSIRLKERKGGSDVFSAGVFTFRPLKQPELCNQKILDPPASNLPLTPIPGVPQLPVPPLGPGIPLVPPVSNLPLPPIPGIPGVPPLGPLIPLIPPAAPREVKEQQVEPSILPPFGILPPNPLLPPPSLLPPNPFFPPPSIIPPIIPSPPPSIFPPLFPSPPPSIFPPILPSPPSPPPSIFPPLFPSPPSPPPSIFPPFPRPIFPPIPGLTPSPPPPPPSPFFPFPFPPFPFQPSPGTPPPEVISSAQKNP